MALTEFQRTICRLIAEQRIQSGESYVAGGAALGAWTRSPRISRDIDLFHDTEEAVATAWEADRSLLSERGFHLRVLRERPSFVEAVVSKDNEGVLMQWAADSAFRFFPLVRHEDFGLTLHAFDLATNKTLALVGRLEVRDWVDLIHCHEQIQSLGLLAWAACGKDPGFSPASILEQAGRSARYSAVEVSELSFEGPAPDAVALSQKWHTMLSGAREIIAVLPPDHVGECVLDLKGELISGDLDSLRTAIRGGNVLFHRGSIRGALPQIRRSS